MLYYFKKNMPKFFLQPAKQYFNEIWPVRKKVWPPLLYIKHSALKILRLFPLVIVSITLLWVKGRFKLILSLLKNIKELEK